MIAYLLLADDLALISETSTGLQRLLDGFRHFCNRWHLTVNMVKTRLSIYNKQYIILQSCPTVSFNGEKIDETSNYNYVGVTFSTDRNRFLKHTDNIIAKANRAIYAAMALARNAAGNELTATTHLKIFDTQIRPIIEYASPVWFNGKNNRDLEKIHTSFLKRALGVGNSTSHLAIYGETGRYPLSLRLQYTTVKYWIRISNLPKTSILHNVYCELINNENIGIKSTQL